MLWNFYFNRVLGFFFFLIYFILVICHEYGRVFWNISVMQQMTQCSLYPNSETSQECGDLI